MNDFIEEPTQTNPYVALNTSSDAEKSKPQSTLINETTQALGYLYSCGKQKVSLATLISKL